MLSIFNIPRDQMTPAQRRLKWMKRECLPEKIRDILDRMDKEKIEVKPKPKPVDTEKPVVVVGAEDYKETAINVKVDFQLDYSKPENVITKLKDIMLRKNKGKHDPKFLIELFSFMLKSIKDERLQLDVTLNLISSMFELAKSSSEGYMSRENWLEAHRLFHSLLTLIKSPVFRDQLKHYLNALAQGKIDHSSENDQYELEKTILPSIVNLLEKMDNELLKAFQSISHQKIEYLQRIRDENVLLHLCDSVQAYL